MKKLLSLLICICLTVCTMTAPVVAQDNEVPERVSGLLNAVGVTKPEDNVNQDATISRGQFAIYAARLAGERFTGESVKYYNDVPEGSFCYDAASVLVNLGALSVPEDKIFNPNNEISYSEACKIMMCVLGFKDYSEARGGYPTGYEFIAKQTDLNMGLDGTEMTFKNVMQMFYNACHIRLLDPQAIIDSYTQWVPGNDTILSLNHDIYYLEGRVDKTNTVSLIDETPIQNDLVQINAMQLYAGKSGIEKDLGHNVEAYYQKADSNSPGTVLYYYDDTEVTIIDIDNFRGYNLGVLTYEDEKADKVKTLSIGASVPILFNGRPVKENITDAFNATGEFGPPNYPTNNGHIEIVYYNNEVSLVHIRRKTTLIIRSTNENQQSVWDEYRNKYFIFDETKYDRINVYKGQEVGEKISFYHMQKTQVLSIYKSLDGKVADVYMADNSIVGTVTQIKDDEVSIDGVFYKINKEMEPYINLSTGIYARFYFDVEGEVSNLEPVIDENIFAYIYDIGSDRSPFDPTIKLKVFTVAGEHKVVDVKLPVNVDGESKTTSDAVLNALSASGDMGTYKQLVGLKFNAKGELKNIDTAAASKEAAEEAGSLVTQVKYTGAGTQHFIPSNNPSFYPAPIYYKGTKVLLVPEEDASVQEDYFKVTDKSYFNKVDFYKISSYKMDYSHVFADIIVVREEFTPANLYGTDMPIMVEEVYERLDADGKPTKVIKGIRQGVLYEEESRDVPVFWNIKTNSGGTATKATYTESSITSVDDLSKGDLIRTVKGIDGKVSGIQILHDFEPNQKPYWYGNGYYSDMKGELCRVNANFTLTAGYVIDVHYDKGREQDWVERPPVVVDLGYEDASTIDRTFLLATDSITIYDIEKDRMFSGTSWEDITAYNSSYGGSYMVVGSVNYNSRGVYLYVYPGGE